MPLPPASVTACAVSWMVPGKFASPALSDRPVTYTVQPWLPSAMAMPRPAPRLPPVTSATVPGPFTCTLQRSSHVVAAVHVDLLPRNIARVVRTQIFAGGRDVVRCARPRDGNVLGNDFERRHFARSNA